MAVMVTTNRAEEMVLHHLLTNTSAAFREKFDKSETSIAGCMKYIMSEARKQAQNNQACIADDEVFGWAVHYFEEDEIKEPSKAPQGEIRVAENKPIPPHDPVPVKKKATDENQLSLFDLMEA